MPEPIGSVRFGLVHYYIFNFGMGRTDFISQTVPIGCRFGSVRFGLNGLVWHGSAQFVELWLQVVLKHVLDLFY